MVRESAARVSGGTDGRTKGDWPGADDVVARVAERRIFFGHQSVGRDILGGVRGLMEEHPALRLRLVETDDPRTVQGPALMEARIGRNREPATKLDAFERIVAGGMEDGDIALLKFCYVDVLGDTDVDALFDDYRERMARLVNRIPGLELLHVTIPLRTVSSSAREVVAGLLGRISTTDLNRRRERFNTRLRDSYAVERVFDLARLEATRADGSLATSRQRGTRVPMLAPEWTHDGGHLNPAGARRAAQGLLDILAGISGAERPADRDRAQGAGDAIRS